jgi:hypothetical protein
MSWQATAWAVKQRTGDPALKLLLLTLANYADDKGCCFPSQATLSEDTEQSVDSVQRKLKQLEAKGLVRKIVRPGKRGQWSGRTYYLNMGVAEMSKPQSAAWSDDEPCRNELVTMPQNGADHAATGTVTMPHSSAALTVIEPSIEQSERENRARATFIPDDFKLSDETYWWAVDRMESIEAVSRSVERFTNHYRQLDGPKAKCRDWDARVRNWIDDDVRRTPPDKSVVAAAKRLQETLRSLDAGPDDTALSDDQWDPIITRFAQTGQWTRHVDQCGNAPPAPDCKAPRHLLIKHRIIPEDEEAA